MREPRQQLACVRTALSKTHCGKQHLGLSVVHSMLACLMLLAVGAAQGQILYVANQRSGIIGEYTSSGVALNTSLISGLQGPIGLAVSGDTLFVANEGDFYGHGSIGAYTTSGATINASLITGLTNPSALAVSGDKLFVLDAELGTVGLYTTSGAVINRSLISGFRTPAAIAVSGDNLFVADNTGIGLYTTSGAELNASFIHIWAQSLVVSGDRLYIGDRYNSVVSSWTTSGIPTYGGYITNVRWPYGLAVEGDHLFVADLYRNAIGEYTTSGATVNSTLITGLQGPWSVVDVPEPAPLTYVIAAACLWCVFRLGRWQRRSAR